MESIILVALGAVTGSVPALILFELERRERRREREASRKEAATRFAQEYYRNIFDAFAPFLRIFHSGIAATMFPLEKGTKGLHPKALVAWATELSATLPIAIAEMQNKGYFGLLPDSLFPNILILHTELTIFAQETGKDARTVSANKILKSASDVRQQIRHLLGVDTTTLDVPGVYYPFMASEKP